MRKARERSRDSLKITSFREVDTWQLHEADNWTSPSTGPQLIWRHFPDRNVIYLKCWFLDKTEGPEEKPLTAEQRRKPTSNSSHILNWELMQLQPSKTRILHVQHFFPEVKFHFLWKKSTQVDDFFFLFLNWREYGQSFLRHETVNGGDRKREFLSVAKQTLYFHSSMSVRYRVTLITAAPRSQTLTSFLKVIA